MRPLRLRTRLVELLEPRGTSRSKMATRLTKVYPAIHYGCAPQQEGLAFRSKGSIGVVADGAASARDPTAPSALTDLGLVLVRPGLPGPLGREEGLDHECQTYRRTICDDERCGTTQGPLLVGAGDDQGGGSPQGRRQTREAWFGPRDRSETGSANLAPR
jgi:hypothetical protein